MITVSLCMIVRNEENSLERCLSCVKDIVDEIVIVDTGSTDKTKEIAASCGAVVYDFEWVDDFAAARNYSFARATCEYILWLDADDWIQEADRKRLKKLKASLDPDIRTVTMPYLLAFDSEGNVTSSLRRNRLVRRDGQFQWVGPVHEYLAVDGSSLDSDVCITHRKDKAYTDRNLRIYRKRAEQGEDFSPRDLYYFANELREHACYEEACDYYERFLASGQGWIEDNYQACLKLADCLERTGDTVRLFQALCRTLQYDTPRSEFCCRLGAYLMAQERYAQAAYWYELAIALPERESMGLKDASSSTWLPHLQLCVCCSRLGDSHKANYHNEMASLYYPSHPSVTYNKTYFKNLLGAAYIEIAEPGPTANMQ